MRRLEAQRARIWSALCCVLFVVTQLAGFAHEATVAHVVCAEHGELVDVDRATMAPDAGMDCDVQPCLRSAPAPATSEHEHCHFAPLHRLRAVTLHECVSVAIAPTPEIAPRYTPVACDRWAIPVYLLAPKQSPPV